MRNIIAIVICIAFLGFGLIRTGVGSAVLAQDLGAIQVDAITEPLIETTEFLAEASSKGFYKFSTRTYLMYIIAMGVVLVVGAIGALRRTSWGYGAITLYLGMHAALFINYQTINPKIAFLGLGIALLLALIWAQSGRNHAK